MASKSCQSENLAFIFPVLVVCVNCGFAELIARTAVATTGEGAAAAILHRE